MTSVKISGEFIKLDSFLKFAAAVQTGGEAKTVIADGAVRVNGEVTTERGRKLRDGAIVAFAGNVWRVMSIDN
ncbi:MAG: RNA-binding S4 domain-containing protein [Oscillospiraceae bacterium]|nr:RNA-binding S4 domain-containing protein [Oscillospiraceae bacterium]